MEIKMKVNPFKEKIGAFRILNSENNKLLDTANGSDTFPALIELVSEIDFFNIKPNADYIFSVNAFFDYDSDDAFQNLYHARVNVPDDFLRFQTISGYGKISAQFKTHLKVEKRSDCYIHSILFENSEETSILDERYDYYYFGEMESETNDK